MGLINLQAKRERKRREKEREGNAEGGRKGGLDRLRKQGRDAEVEGRREGVSA